MWCSYLNRALGRYRRHKGLYDKGTLRCFAAAWRSAGSPVNLLSYAMFRRDLGRPLPARWVGLLVAAVPNFSPAERRMALGLLAEARPDCLSGMDLALLSDGMRLPAIASRMSGIGNDFRGLARIDECQPNWQAAFADQFRSAQSSGGVAVIGNAATQDGLKAAAHIDQCGLVVRFNHFMGRSELVEDVGRRTDVWVVSPGYVGPAPERVSWIVMSGPDVRYRLSDWRHVMPLVEQGVPLLTIPLAVWQPLIPILKAPPSAGVLFLAYLTSLAGGNWRGVQSAGIGSGLAKGGRYHASLPRHMASGRHSWEREASLVQVWRQEGLASLAADNREAP